MHHACIQPVCLLSRLIILSSLPLPLPVDLSFVVVSRDRLSDCAHLKSSLSQRRTDDGGAEFFGTDPG